MNLIRIQHFLQEECHFLPGCVISVAVSGGADSICLVHLLSSLGYNTLVMHFDHHIRPESGKDADFVRHFCNKHHLDFIFGEGYVPGFASQNHLSIEEAARKLRYQFLFASARQHHAQAVLTAHHANDQAETILMHLIRGSGSAGLRGMQKRTFLPDYDPDVPLIRPLLETEKEDILDYCSQNGLEFIHDKSNDDESYFRNWLRHRLIPIIQERNPQIHATLNRTSQVLSDELEWMEDVLLERWKTVLVDEGKDYLRFEYPQVSQFQAGLFRAFARKAIRFLRPTLRDIDFDDIERMRQFVLHPPRSRQVDLVANLKLILEDGKLILCDHRAVIPVRGLPQVKEIKSVQLSGKTTLSEGYTLFTELLDKQHLELMNWQKAGSFHAWLDLDKLQGSLFVRGMQPGDRIALLGQDGHTTKVSDVYINHKVPRSARAYYPLVCDDHQIIWIPGIQISEGTRISDTTTRAIHFWVHRCPL